MTQIGPYVVEEEVARGGMGVVYRARLRGEGPPVALKVLESRDRTMIERFRREAEAAMSVRHPGIVPCQDVGAVGGVHYMALDFVEGGSLADRLRREGPLPVEEALALIESAARTLGYAHSQGVLHRDIKPANILLREGKPLITDFGIGQVESAQQRLTQTGELLGTPEYMSPEQADGSKGLGPQTDVYALGATLYALLTGSPPFRAKTSVALIKAVLLDAPAPPSKARPEVPSGLDALVLRCLAKSPAERFPTGDALADALLLLRSRHATSPGRSSRGLLGGGLLAALLVLGGAFVALLPRGEEPRVSDSESLPKQEREASESESESLPKEEREASGSESESLPKEEREASESLPPLGAWRVLETEVAPPPRQNACATYHPDLGVVVFGGRANKRAMNDLWAWNGSEWTELPDAGDKPGPRHRAAMAYDEDRGVLVLFGGEFSSKPIGGLYEHDGERWKQVGDRGPQSRARAQHTLTHVPGRGVLLHGGYSRSKKRLSSSAPLWAWKGEGWIPVKTQGEPSPARRHHHAVYDPVGQRLLIYGGEAQSREVVELSFREEPPAWKSYPVQEGDPPGRASPGLAWVEDRLLLYGGWLAGDVGAAIHDLWTWSESRGWEELRPDPMPPARSSHSLVYDPRRGTVVMWGGGESDASGNRKHLATTWECRVR